MGEVPLPHPPSQQFAKFSMARRRSFGEKTLETLQTKTLETKSRERTLLRSQAFYDLSELVPPKSMSDLNEEDFIEAIEKATLNNSEISRKLAHGILVGPTGSGKSSLMDRLLGRPRKQFSPSTGVAEPVVVVDVSIDNPSSFHSVTVIEGTWKEIECNESFIRQMDGAKPPDPSANNVFVTSDTAMPQQKNLNNCH